MRSEERRRSCSCQRNCRAVRGAAEERQRGQRSVRGAAEELQRSEEQHMSGCTSCPMGSVCLASARLTSCLTVLIICHWLTVLSQQKHSHPAETDPSQPAWAMARTQPRVFSMYDGRRFGRWVARAQPGEQPAPKLASTMGHT